MSIAKRYTEEIKNQLKYRAAWFPNRKLSPGLIGRIKDSVFEPLTSLKRLGIKFETGPGAHPADHVYSAQGAVEWSFKAKGDSPIAAAGLAQAEAGVDIQFKRRFAILFHLHNEMLDQIEDKISLKNQVMKRYYANRWDKDWVVITEVIKAERAVIMMASKRRARVGIKLRADIKGSIPNLASIDSYVGISKANGVENEIVGTRGLTPLYKAAGIKEHLFSGPEFVYTKDYYIKQRVPLFAEI